MHARQFRQAAASGDLDSVKNIYAADKSIINSVGPDSGKTALHQAADYGRTDIIAWLCKSGANVDAQDNNGNTPINLAVQSVKYASLSVKAKVISTLIKSQANVLLANNAGQTVLMNMIPIRKSVVSKPHMHNVVNNIIRDIKESIADKAKERRMFCIINPNGSVEFIPPKAHEEVEQLLRVNGFSLDKVKVIDPNSNDPVFQTSNRL